MEYKGIEYLRRKLAGKRSRVILRYKYYETVSYTHLDVYKRQRLILWTNREGMLLEEALEWCAERGLVFDTVNENLPELIELYKNDCRKINADIYIDDKAVNPVGYRQAAGLSGFDPYKNPVDRDVYKRQDLWCHLLPDAPLP